MDTRRSTRPSRSPGSTTSSRSVGAASATVYRGWQAALRREVAVKVLDAPAVDAASERRFEREAMAMGSLSGHPNVVPVYDAGSVAGRPYLVMPLLRDGSLQDQLAAGPLPAEEVVRLGQGLADALSAAHAAGVLHRDVKPANVLRTSHGVPQLTDFGVAQVADMTLTLGGDLVATVAYAAPEVLSGEPATEASDVYSLGATLYAAARGEAPFAAGPDDSPMSLAVRVMTADPPDLRGTGVPEGLGAVIERAMARDSAERYPSARGAAPRARRSGADHRCWPGHRSPSPPWSKPLFSPRWPRPWRRPRSPLLPVRRRHATAGRGWCSRSSSWPSSGRPSSQAP